MRDYYEICRGISPARIDGVLEVLRKQVMLLPEPWFESDFQMAIDALPRDVRIVLAETSRFGSALFVNDAKVRFIEPMRWDIAKMLALYEEREGVTDTKMTVSYPSVTELMYLPEERRTLDTPRWVFKVTIPPLSALKTVANL